MYSILRTLEFKEGKSQVQCQVWETQHVPESTGKPSVTPCEGNGNTKEKRKERKGKAKLLLYS